MTSARVRPHDCPGRRLAAAGPRIAANVRRSRYMVSARMRLVPGQRSLPRSRCRQAIAARHVGCLRHVHRASCRCFNTKETVNDVVRIFVDRAGRDPRADRVQLAAGAEDHGTGDHWRRTPTWPARPGRPPRESPCKSTATLRRRTATPWWRHSSTAATRDSSPHFERHPSWVPSPSRVRRSTSGGRGKRQSPPAARLCSSRTNRCTSWAEAARREAAEAMAAP